MIPRRNSGSVVPMSFAQELLWLLDRATPGLTAYNVPRAVRIRGTLSVDALRRAIDTLVERHEILRTTYAHDARGAVQIIHPPRPVDVTMMDLRGAPASERMAQAERFFLEQARTPFNLEADLLLRAHLLQLDTDDHVLILVSHHIASDGWSRGVMFRELSEAYRAYSAGHTPALSPLPIQYADFAVWQRAESESGSLVEHLQYWHERLAPPLPSLDLPTDFPRPSTQSFEGARRAIILPSELVGQLRMMGMEHNATLYMVLLAAYQTVLHRYSGQADIITGSPVAGRSHAEVEGLIGYFANTLAMRTNFRGDPTFADVLERIAENAVDAYEHQDVPFEKLVLDLREAHEASGDVSSDAPLFRHVLTMEDTLPDALRLGDATVDTIAIDFGMAKFDLTLLVAEQPEGLRLALWYRTDLFTEGYAERFLGHFRNVLEAAVANVNVRISALPLLSRVEQAQLDAWNATSVNEGPSETLVELFERQAARVPHASAIVGSATTDAAKIQTLTYAALNARANQLARRLRELGVTTGSPVGLLLDRNVDAFVGLVGILKAGAAYMPLSVDAPATRVAQQVAESGATTIITVASLTSLVPSGVTTVSLDRDAATLDVLASDNVSYDISPTSLAYILYTSGSTGVPKGVAVTHANAVHYARAMSRVLADTPAGEQGDGLANLDGWTFGLVSTLAADLGNTSVLPALLGGGTIHVLAKDVAMDATRFAEYVHDHPLDVLKITPNHFAALTAGKSGRELSSVLPRRWLVLGGEALSLTSARTWLHANVCRVLNHYGPTETTVGALTFEVTDDALRQAEQSGAQTAPIGRPLANTRAYVVDALGNDQPISIPGELCLGGAGVAEGYFQRPELSAERFVSVHNERVYRTGDRVRRLPSGAIEFLGRLDHQVKVRGFRVELGEIEQVVTEHPGVAHVVVALHAGADQDQRLVAYVVPRLDGYAAAHAERANTESVTLWVQARLPEYMVPSHVVVLDALPLTANGKVDRRALPDPEVVVPIDAYVAPRTEMESALAAIWTEVLKKDRIGVTETFMALGGQSLLAIRVLGKLSRQFGIRLPLRTLFDAPTIAELAVVVETEVNAAKQRELDALLQSLDGVSDEEVQRLMSDPGQTS